MQQPGLSANVLPSWLLGVDKDAAALNNLSGIAIVRAADLVVMDQLVRLVVAGQKQSDLGCQAVLSVLIGDQGQEPGEMEPGGDL